MDLRNIKYKTRQLKRSVVDAFIMRGYRSRFSNTLIVETTNICSLKCSCCPNGISHCQLRPHGMMSRDTFELFMRQMDMPVKKCYLHMCGEPLLNKNIIYFTRKLLERKITPIFFSNGYNIDMSLLDELIKTKGIKIAFSMDLLSKEHYESIRKPGSYDVAKESLKCINSVFAQNSRYYGLNIIVSPESIMGITSRCEQLFEDFSNLNSISLSSQWPWPGIPQTGYLPGHLREKADLCIRYRDLPVVLWNGDVSFCSFDYSGSLVIGNIYEQKYSQICNNSKARKIRRNLLTKAYNKQTFCKSCLLCRYQPFDIILMRNKYKKMSLEQLADFEKYLNGYFGG